MDQLIYVAVAPNTSTGLVVVIENTIARKTTINTVAVPSFASGVYTACRIHIGITNIAMPVTKMIALTRKSMR